MKIKINYQEGLRTSAEHLSSGKKLITDAPVDNHGKGETFSPTDLLCVALGSCMLTVMGIKARKMGIELHNLYVEIDKIMHISPRKVSKIKINMYWNQSNTFTKEQINILKDEALSCPVALSLHPKLHQDITFHFKNH